MIYICKKEECFLNLEDYFKSIYISFHDVLIVLDNIFAYKSDVLNKIINIYKSLQITIIFINNEKHVIDYPLINIFNVKMYKISNNIFFLNKKEIFTINNFKFLYAKSKKDFDFINNRIDYLLTENDVYKVSSKSLVKCKYKNNIAIISNYYMGNNKKKINHYLYLEINKKSHNLYSDFKYKTSLKASDLPEWYIKGLYYHQKGYLSSKDITSFKYIANYYYKKSIDNDTLILFYKNGYVCHVLGKEIFKIILAYEKYMQKDLSYLKNKIKFRLNFNKSKVNYKLNSIEYIIYSLYKKIIVSGVNEINGLEIILASNLSDKIFKKDKRYLSKSVDKLFIILKNETKLKIKDIIDYEEDI